MNVDYSETGARRIYKTKKGNSVRYITRGRDEVSSIPGGWIVIYEGVQDFKYYATTISRFEGMLDEKDTN